MRRGRALSVLFGILVALAMVSGSSVAQSASQTDQTPVDIAACTTIDEPGHYRLSENVTAGETPTCVRITANDVVLDGGDHLIHTGDEETETGILVRGDNVTVRDLSVAGISRGIVFRNVSDGSVRGVRVTESFWAGVWILETDTTTVRDLTVTNTNLDGIRVHSSRSVLVRNATLSNNGAGISTSRSANLTVRQNTLSDNQLGAQVMTTRDSTVAFNDVSNNRIGVVLALADANRVQHNRLQATETGIRLDGADENVVSNNRIIASTFGIFLSESADNALVSNDIESDSVGVQLTLDSDQNQVKDNTVSATETGIEITSSTRNSLSNNRIEATNGFSVANSGENTMSDNRITVREQTAAADDQQEQATEAVDTTESGRDSTERSGPGFGVLLAVIAFSVAALVHRWR